VPDVWDGDRVIKVSDAEAIACAFHNQYEAQAPKYGYKTREASAVNWNDEPEQNKQLMISVVAALLHMGIIELGARFRSSDEPTEEQVKIIDGIVGGKLTP
jgi:hypothetical protein